MANIRIPQGRALKPIQYRAPKDFTDQILAVNSYSPLAQGIETFGQVGSKAIETYGAERKKRKDLADAVALGTQLGMAPEQLQGLKAEDAAPLRQIFLNRATQTPEEKESKALGMEKTRAEIDELGRRQSGANVILPGFTLGGAPATVNTRSGTAVPLQAPGGQKFEKIVQQPRGANEMSLRKEFSTHPVVRDFANTARSVQRIVDAAKDPSGAGDLALIFNYMKTLDPGSTVREGEFATAQNSAGLDERTRAQYNKVISGERLSPNQREDFVDRAMRLYEGQEQANIQIENQYRTLAEQSGLDPEQSVVDFKIKGLRRNKLQPLPSPSASGLTSEQRRQRISELKAKTGR